MARFSSESIERVRDAVDIAEVLAPYTELRRAGQRMQGLCPFHDERTPSFSVNPPGQALLLLRLWGGGRRVHVPPGEGGACRSPSAVETLADRFGVEVEREQEDPRVEEARKRRARLGELLDRTAEYYVEVSVGVGRGGEGAGVSARAWAERGELAGVRALGLRRTSGTRLWCAASRAGFTLAELMAAGLVKKGQKGGYLDHFRARIMFPIRDGRGRMQGFGGRATREEQRAKYVNSPEGELFHKSRHALRDRSGAGGDREEGAGGGGRGVYGRDCRAPGGS